MKARKRTCAMNSGVEVEVGRAEKEVKPPNKKSSVSYLRMTYSDFGVF